MNHATIIGNICSAPEARTTQSGISCSNFKVAVQRRFKNANGEREADFIPVVAWRSTADYCNKYLKKGSKVAVVGSIQTRTYDAKDGTKRYITEIVAEEVDGLDKPSGNAGSTPKNSVPKPTMDEQGYAEVDDMSDLPF